jgi:hypothetical protein
MNTDSYYEIGESHLVCQDYALSGHINNTIAFAIVSDGCSSSVEVDVGARILSHVAKYYLHMCYESKTEIDPNNIGECNKQFRNFVSTPSISISQLMKLQTGALDATLIMAVCDGKVLNISMYGDGGFIIRYRDGRITYRFVEFESGAPYYISYTMNANRRAGYIETFQNPVNFGCMHLDICNTISNISQKIEVIDIPENIYDKSDFIIDLSDNAIESVSLVSDGIRSYRKQSLDGANVSDITAFDMARQFVDFKNYIGTFIQRRMHKVKQVCRKDNITHYDDISVATIHMS